MKKGWEMKRLGDILERTETINPSQSPNTEFDYIDVSSVSNSTFLIEETKRFKGIDAPSRARKLVRTNDIIFATIRPTLQRIAVVPKHLDKQVCSTGYFVLRPKHGIDHHFIFYSLFSESFIRQMKNLQKGASYPAVTDSDVRMQVIPVPPLAEQRRIVGVLDEAFAGLATAKANAEKNLQNARALFESHLNDVFTRRGPGWVEKRLGEVCEIERGGSPRPIKKFLTTDPNGINWIKIGDATASRKYILRTEEKIIPEGAKRSRMVYEGDFILSNSMSFGRPYIMKTTGCIHDGWLVLRQPNADPDYLYQVLGSNLVFAQFDRLAAGSTVRNLNIGLAKSVSIPLPPITQQRAIAATLDALSAETSRLAAIYSRKLAALEALKKSLLHDAFRGAL